MNLNELIKKYEDKVKECEKQYIYLNHISNIYKEILQDLKQLKEITGE